MTDFLFRNLRTGDLLVQSSPDILEAEGLLPEGDWAVAVVGEWAADTVTVASPDDLAIAPIPDQFATVEAGGVATVPLEITGGIAPLQITASPRGEIDGRTLRIPLEPVWEGTITVTVTDAVDQTVTASAAVLVVPLSTGPAYLEIREGGLRVLEALSTDTLRLWPMGDPALHRPVEGQPVRLVDADSGDELHVIAAETYQAGGRIDLDGLPSAAVVAKRTSPDGAVEIVSQTVAVTRLLETLDMTAARYALEPGRVTVLNRTPLPEGYELHYTIWRTPEGSDEFHSPLPTGKRRITNNSYAYPAYVLAYLIVGDAIVDREVITRLAALESYQPVPLAIEPIEDVVAPVSGSALRVPLIVSGGVGPYEVVTDRGQIDGDDLVLERDATYDGFVEIVVTDDDGETVSTTFRLTVEAAEPVVEVTGSGPDLPDPVYAGSTMAELVDLASGSGGPYTASDGSGVSVSRTVLIYDGEEQAAGSTAITAVGIEVQVVDDVVTASGHAQRMPGDVRTLAAIEADVSPPAAFGVDGWSLSDRPSIEGDQLTLSISSVPDDGGDEITAIQYRIDSGSGYGAWQTLAGVGTGPRTITVLAEAAATVQLRAVNSAGAGPISAAQTATPTIAETSPVGPTSADVEPQEWTVLPSGDQNVVELDLPDTWSGDAVSAVQVRTQPLDATPSSTVLSDPTGAWGAWKDVGQTNGRVRHDVGTSAPIGLQLRVLRGDLWSDPAFVFKRVGDYYFSGDDLTVATIPGCVGDSIPETLIWGTDNAAGEGAQRVPDGASAVASGDAGDHFDVVSRNGRRYLVPNDNAVAAWSAGDTYAITLDDGTTLNVRIDEHAAAIAGGAEFSTWMARLEQGTREYVCYIRGTSDGAIRYEDLTGNNLEKNGKFLNGLPIRIASDREDFAARIDRLYLGPRVFREAAQRDLTFEGIDFFRPMCWESRVGTSTAIQMLTITPDDQASALRFRRCRWRSDYIEGRFGFQLRSPDPETRIEGIEADRCNLEVRDCVFTRLDYAIHAVGCDGAFDRNLVTHVAYDYMNFKPNGESGRHGPMSIRNNRLREHCGDQCASHSDIWHTFENDGVFDGYVVEGNLAHPGYEAQSAPAGVTALVTNIYFHPEQDTTLGQPEHDHRFIICDTSKHGDMTLTLLPPGEAEHDPQFTQAQRSSKEGHAYGIRNVGKGTVTVTDGAGFSRAYTYMQTAEIRARRRRNDDDVYVWYWEERTGNKTVQGIPYQNRGDQCWKRTTVRNNIILGINTITGMFLSGHDPKKTGDIDASRDVRYHNNAVIPYLFTPDDDLDGSGQVDTFDGLNDVAPRSRWGDLLVGRADGEIVWDQPVGLTDFRNITGAQSTGRWQDEWVNRYLGSSMDGSVSDREVYLANGGHDWRPAVDTFEEVIEFARLKPGTEAAARYLGPVGPTDDAPGHYNFTSGERNAFPPPRATHVYPAQGDDAARVAEPLRMWFDWPIQVSPGAVRLRDETANQDIAVTARADGRQLVIDHPGLTHGRSYHVIVPGGAVAIYDDEDVTYAGASDPSDWRFTADRDARLNEFWVDRSSAWLDQGILPYQADDWISTAGVTSYIDTLRDAKATIPNGPAQHSVEVQADTGTAELTFRIYNGDIHTPSLKLVIEVDTASGEMAVTEKSGTDVGAVSVGESIVPVAGGWQITIQSDWSILETGRHGNPPRYIIEINTNGNAQSRWRHLAMYQEHDADIPFSAPMRPWSGGTASGPLPARMAAPTVTASGTTIEGTREAVDNGSTVDVRYVGGNNTIIDRDVGTTFVRSGLEPDTVYDVSVREVDGEGPGQWSLPTSVPLGARTWSYADSVIQTSFDAPEWDYSGSASPVPTEVDGWLEAPDASWRADSRPRHDAPIPEAASDTTLTVVVDVRRDGSSESMTLDLRDTDASVRATPRLSTATWEVAKNGGEAGTVRITDDVYRFWAKIPLLGGHRTIVAIPISGLDRISLAKPAIFHGDVPVDQMLDL